MNYPPLPTEVGSLGPIVSEHRVVPSRQKSNLIMGVLLLVAGLGGMGLGISSALKGDTDSLYICNGFGLLIALGGAWVLQTYRQEKEMVIVACRDGLAYVRKSGVQIMRWDEVTAVWMSITRHRRSGNTVHTYRLGNEQNNNLTFIYAVGELENIEELGNTVQKEVTSRLFPKWVQKYNAGETLSFGALTVSKQGLGNGKEVLPWSDVAEVQLRNGHIAVRKQDKWLNWSWATVGQIPNIYVFTGLVEQIVGINKPKAQG